MRTIANIMIQVQATLAIRVILHIKIRRSCLGILIQLRTENVMLPRLHITFEIYEQILKYINSNAILTPTTNRDMSTVGKINSF